jgi:hypothetical protein
MARFYYYIPNNGETADDARPFESCNLESEFDDYPHVRGDVAEAAAEHYHDRHDGWEADWPLEFMILGRFKNELGLVEVDRGTRPVFDALV